MRASFDILLLPGDGIGPEVVEAARVVADAAADHFGAKVSYEERKIGAAAIRDEDLGSRQSLGLRPAWRGRAP